MKKFKRVCPIWARVLLCISILMGIGNISKYGIDGVVISPIAGIMIIAIIIVCVVRNNANSDKQ